MVEIGGDLTHLLTDRSKTRLAGMTCPDGHDGLTIKLLLKSKPIGTFGIAGAQMKVVASEQPYVVCPTCKWKTEADLDPTEGSRP